MCTLRQVNIEQPAHLEEQLTCRNIALGCVLLSEFIKPNIYSEQIDWNIAANFSIDLYIVVVYSSLYVDDILMSLWDRSAFWMGGFLLFKKFDLIHRLFRGARLFKKLSSVCNEATVKASSWEQFLWYKIVYNEWT